MKSKTTFLTILLTFLFLNVISQTVYITKTGTKYHVEGCKYLSKSKTSITITDAISRGYNACSVCNPQSKTTSLTTPKKNPINTESKTTPTQKEKTITQSVESQCSATTKAGSRCKRTTKSSNGKCWQHGGD